MITALAPLKPVARPVTGTQPITVMNVVDSLAFGGTERSAINIVNHLPPEQFRPVLCTTRADGAQDSLVAPHVERLRLNRRTLSDNFTAIRALARYIEEKDVRVLHAHTSSIFISRLAAALSKRTAVIWHAHWGAVALEDRRMWPYQIAAARVDAAIAVNSDLEAWIRRRFSIRQDRIWYLPNIATVDPVPEAAKPQLPGVDGKRILCVANIRPEKDHVTLIRAMDLVRRRHPDAHLILAGVPLIPDSVDALNREIEARGLRAAVTYLGPRSDAQALMRCCDIGVLSSQTEGLPVSLLEYGMAELPVVTTSAGQCGEVVGQGEAGLLVPPGSPELLAKAIDRFLSDSFLRQDFRRRFHSRVKSVYGPQAVIERLTDIYRSVLRQ